MLATDVELLSVLVVDDERPGRERVVQLLKRDSVAMDIVQAATGMEALLLLESRSFDLLFLDVQMPELSGIEVLKQLDSPDVPVVILVTAYDDYALAAFESNVSGYLLKPFTEERFRSTFERARRRVEEKRAIRHLETLTKGSNHSSQRLDKLIVRHARRLEFVNVDDIVRIESAGMYVTIYHGISTCLYRSSLNALAMRLDDQTFVRVHRTSIINLRCIVRLVPISHGEFHAMLSDGSTVRVSRNFSAKLRERFNSFR